MLKGVEKTVRNSAARKILFIVAISVFLFSTTMVLKHRVEMRIGAEQAEAVVQMAVTPVSKQEGPEPAVQVAVSPAPNQSESEDPAITNDEPDVFSPIQVDFDALFAKNQDVIAWLYCQDTPINYPVVQASDNEYYLRRLLDGSRNTAGTLFMDYRNATDLSDWNSVIYGHNLHNDSMFGTLPDYQAQSYFQAHPEMFLLTPEQDYVIELIAGFTTSASSELYNTFVPGAAEKTRLLENWRQDSDFVSNITPTAEDRLIAFSTCSYEYSDARYVLIGILKECNKIPQ